MTQLFVIFGRSSGLGWSLGLDPAYVTALNSKIRSHPFHNGAIMQNRRAFLGMTSILLFSGLADADDSPPKKEVSTLNCDLIVEQDTGTDDSVFAGVLLVKNTTKDLTTIEYVDDPTEHLSLEVRDLQGKLLPVVSKYYGDLYTKAHLSDEDDTPRKLIIEPGETYRQNLALLALVDPRRGKVAPGQYTVQAVFRNDKQEFRSERKSITIVAD